MLKSRERFEKLKTSYDGMAWYQEEDQSLGMSFNRDFEARLTLIRTVLSILGKSEKKSFKYILVQPRRKREHSG